jgi:hypothetical protein
MPLKAMRACNFPKRTAKKLIVKFSINGHHSDPAWGQRDFEKVR